MQTDQPRKSVLQRLAFIEQRLYWEGRLVKQDLVDHFGISLPQASLDVSTYQRRAPGNMAYDSREKAFLPSEAFEPMWIEPDARSYLSQLLLLADEVIAEKDSWLGAAPSLAAIPKVRRRLDAKVLRAVVGAIRTKQALEVSYQSMSRMEPGTRWIAPHGLAFDGFRWHTRAWCYNRSMFIDLVLARFISVGSSRPAEVDGRVDREWNEHIVVKLAPHPELPQAHRRAIELDYGMEDGHIGVRMRLALFYYFERHLCLDIEAEPKRKQVVILNREEIDMALRPLTLSEP